MAPKTPTKVTKTPTKVSKTPTRSSPRKRAWASPAKAAKIPSLFDESDLPPLNASWAEIEEKDTGAYDRIVASCDRDRAASRKSAQPKKNQTTKPKFVKSIELSESLYTVGKRSERLRVREERLAVTVTEEVPVKTSTPKNEKNQASRKRHLSNASTIPDEVEGCSPSKRHAPIYRTPNSCGRPARKHLREGDGTPRSSARVRLFDSAAPSAVSSPGSVKSMIDPSRLCTDEPTLARRTKEIEKAKEKPIYAKYLALVPRESRLQRDIHPRTPNKHLNFSRRSWDQQMRIWKRKLYAACGDEPSESVAGSDCDESLNTTVCTEVDDENEENVPRLTDIPIEIRPETDVMASLLGKFDMDTRSGNESTLKAPTTGEATGPVDFSSLQQQ